MKIIKRYKNRKLWDTELSCYTALKTLFLNEDIKNLRFIDNVSGNDITKQCLAHMIVEVNSVIEEKELIRFLTMIKI